MGRRGNFVVGALIGIAIFSAAYFGFLQMFQSGRRTEEKMVRKVLAQSFSSELLEFFRSLTNLQLTQYTGLGGTRPYPLCTWVNALDRTSGSITSADPIASLPGSRLDRGAPEENANRSYKIEVFDLTTGNTKPTACGNFAVAGATPTLGPNDRYYVTVRVSWLEPKKTEEESVWISTVLVD